LVRNIPGALDAYTAHQQNDRNGTDWWVEMVGGRFLSVDCKVREEDYAHKPPKYEDDLALETWSVIEERVPGWTLDKGKRSEYILWVWKDSGRWVMIPFPMLLKAFRGRKDRWVQLYKVGRQETTDGNTGQVLWRSECVFVPRKAVWAEILRIYGGSPNYATKAKV